VSYSHFDP